MAEEALAARNRGECSRTGRDRDRLRHRRGGVTTLKVNSFIASQTALDRVGLPDDIGGVIASLLSPENDWINAQRIAASAGMFL